MDSSMGFLKPMDSSMGYKSYIFIRMFFQHTES
jgi:hypothetical protein